jgi:hypothetical protein
MTSTELRAQLERIEKQIVTQKALEKLQACKLTNKTADKYAALQQRYLNTLKA